MTDQEYRFSTTLNNRHTITSVSGSILLLGLFSSFFLETYLITDIYTNLPSARYLLLSGVCIGLFLIWVFYHRPYASCYPLTVVGMSCLIVGMFLTLPLTVGFSLGVSMFMALIGLSHTLEMTY